ncbi:DUF6000 family protein [Streptomyces sp. NBC_01763]|uniref:DUF6000 family protein n=1 Tax=Streptomyces sp. NBC_01763 TaxID=2975934 RepID=UPI002DDAA268|nr:DUF6000 family protein [Streptomyces sp. NBC_01763]WSC35220.1 DUF6000 family protein [Streptomyces sp. NBC_01763]
MPIQHPAEIGYGYVIERYVTTGRSRSAPLGRYGEVLSGHFTRQEGAVRKRFVRGMVHDATAITDEELEALFDFESRARLTASWLVGVGRRHKFCQQIGDLLLASELTYAGRGYCFALTRLGTHEDAEILTAYLDHYLPRLDLRYDQPDALGALLHLDAQLGTEHAARFTAPDGPWERWVNALPHLRDHPGYAPTDQRQSADTECDFANGWSLG